MVYKRAVIWVAVSSKRQAKNDKISLAYQEQLAREWCAENGYHVIEILAVPGHSRSQPDLFKLLEDYEDKGVDAYKRLRAMWYEKAFDVLVAFSTDRLGRSGTLIHWVVECTILNGAEIYLTDDGGIINKDNFRDKALYGTAQATKPMDSLHKKTKRAKSAAAAKGLTTGGKTPLSHLILRDPKNGTPIGTILNEEARPLYHRIAELLIDNCGWNRIPFDLYREGFMRPDGKPYSRSTVHNMIMNPKTFGNVAESRWHNSSNEKFAGVGRWIFDEGSPIPEGVKVYYGVIPAMFEGQIAEDLKAELRRRMITRGRSQVDNRYRFSRMAVCDECGSYMRVQISDSKRRGLICSVGSNIHHIEHCSQKRAVSTKTLEAFVNTYIERAMSLSTPPSDDQPKDPSEIEQLQAKIGQLQIQSNRLIDELADAPETLRPNFRDKIRAAGEKLDTLNERLASLQAIQRSQIQRTKTETATLDLIRQIGIENFWALPDPEVNQHIHRLFGDLKLKVRDKQVVGLRLKIPK